MLPPAERWRMDVSRTSTFHTEPQKPTTDGHQAASEVSVSPPHPIHSKAWRKWLIRVLVLLAIAVAIVPGPWYTQRPQEGGRTQATVSTITETIASSGRVRGVTETVVGAQAAGIVETLYVDEGDRDTAGQALATLKRDGAQARLAQAEQALKTPRAPPAPTQSDSV